MSRRIHEENGENSNKKLPFKSKKNIKKLKKFREILNESEVLTEAAEDEEFFDSGDYLEQTFSNWIDKI